MVSVSLVQMTPYLANILKTRWGPIFKFVWFSDVHSRIISISLKGGEKRPANCQKLT